MTNQDNHKGHGNTSPIVSTAAKAGPRHSAPPARDERSVFLPLMRAAGRAGINKDHFQAGTGPCSGPGKITQVARLVHTLEREGFVFLHERRPEESRFVFYVLVAEPTEARQPAQKLAPAPEATEAQQSGLFADAPARKYQDPERQGRRA